MLLITDIRQILRQAHQNTLRSINMTMLTTYWLVGRRILEEEQVGENRPVYDTGMIKNITHELHKQFGKGFSITNLQIMGLFYFEFPIPQTASVNLPEHVQQAASEELPDTSISETVSRNLEINISQQQTLTAKRGQPNYETESRNFEIPIFQLSWSHYHHPNN